MAFFGSRPGLVWRSPSSSPPPLPLFLVFARLFFARLSIHPYFGYHSLPRTPMSCVVLGIATRIEIACQKLAQMITFDIHILLHITRDPSLISYLSTQHRTSRPAVTVPPVPSYMASHAHICFSLAPHQSHNESLHLYL